MAARLKYGIENLEWQQFELLAFKCLQRDISPSIQYLERGHDKGRDFIFEGITNYFGKINASESFLFQAKHKSKLDDFSSLKRDLVGELEKVYIQNSLRYQRYCLVTNLTLTGNEFDELTFEFSNIKKEHNLPVPEKFEIYSYRHFESCLDKNKDLRLSFPSIIRIADFKSLLEEIFQRTQQNIVSSWLKVFEKNASRFVYTSIYESALNKLKESNALLLSGPPKSGKTFTAEMIALNKFLVEEYIPYPINNIDAFYDYFDLSKKQLFLFDDSIGKHSIESYRADALNRSVNSILQLLDDTHKIIFTSREYIIKDYQSYSDSDVFLNGVSKVNASASDWSLTERESLFRRYFRLAFDKIPNVPAKIIEHKNFEPESIRAYFDSRPTEFNYLDFINHLNRPDQYLAKLFNNIDEDKKIVLISVLLSLNGSEKDIGYTFINVLADLKIQKLISIKLQLEILQDSVIVKKGDTYGFMHPSMFDFFVQTISRDIGTYRHLMFKNINLSLLSLISFKTNGENHKVIFFDKTDLPNLSIGLVRMLKKPSITLFEINSIFAWFVHPDFQLMKRTKTQGYSDLKRSFIRSLQTVDYTQVTANTNIFHAIDFIKNVSLEGEKDTLNSMAIEQILKGFKQDSNYWQLAIRTSSFLDEMHVMKLIGKDWFKDFHNEIRRRIDQLGTELYGKAYPYFKELNHHKALARSTNDNSLESIQRQQRSYYLQRTNFEWYPTYVKVKQQMGVLKSCPPYGYHIYSTMIEKFALIMLLEDHEKKRYTYKLKNEKWDMINGHQPHFMDDDDYARMEEEHFLDIDERKKEEE